MATGEWELDGEDVLLIGMQRLGYQGYVWDLVLGNYGTLSPKP